jgi:hypothetical protein
MNILYTKKAELKVPKILLTEIMNEFGGQHFLYDNDSSNIMLDLDGMRWEDEEENTKHIENLTTSFNALNVNTDALMYDVSTLSLYY